MSILEVDVGNTAFKWRQIEKCGEILMQGRCSHDGPVLDIQWQRLPERVFFASVASQERIDTMKRLLGLPEPLEFVRVETTPKLAGVENGYDDLSALGVDRWLGLCAAYSASRLQADRVPVMVVDCGSAITLDFADAAGRHQGGYILPGLRMMLNSLAQGTSEVGMHDILGSLAPGRVTSAAVGHGVIFSAVAVIEKSLQQARKQLGEHVLVYITGGDAEYILPHLVGVNAVCRPDLVLDGISCYWQEYTA